MSTVLVAHALAQPPEEVGSLLLELVEDQWFDRKSIKVQPARLAEAEIAFANAEGGTIVVGLWNKSVEGVDANKKHTNDLMQAALDHSQPPVRAKTTFVDCVSASGVHDHLLVIEVEPSNVVHSNRRDEVFLRVGDETRKLTFHQRQELLYDKGQAAYEATAVPGTARSDVNEELLGNYAKALGHPNTDRLLLARGFAVESGVLTIAGLLLFGEYPQRHLPTALVRILRYRGTERGTGARQQLVEDARCEGPIPRVLSQAAAHVRRLQPTRRALARSGLFEPTGLVPQDAWLEGLVNAVVHRSYSIGGDHIRIEVFDDRIEIESPGRFPGLVDIENPLNTTRFARNPRIARVCADLNFGQELGEGIRRMFEEMRLAGLADPLYRQTSGSVRLTLSGTPIDRALEARLPPTSRLVLSALRDAGRLGTGDMVQLLGVSRPVAIRQLNRLRDAGLIDWVGNSARDPRAYWQLPGS